MNDELPPLPFWQARSFWAQVLLVLSVALNAFHVDLNAVLTRIGFGSQDQLIDALVVLAPVALSLWAWLERRAPRFRLVLWK